MVRHRSFWNIGILLLTFVIWVSNAWSRSPTPSEQKAIVTGIVQKLFPERHVGQRVLRYVLLRDVKDFHSDEAMIRICMEGCDAEQIIDFQQLGLEVGFEVRVSGSFQAVAHRGRDIQSRVILAEDISLISRQAPQSLEDLDLVLRSRLQGQ